MQQFPPNEEPKKEEIAKGERKHNCRLLVLLLLPPKVIFGSPELNSPGEEEREGVAVPKNGWGENCDVCLLLEKEESSFSSLMSDVVVVFTSFSQIQKKKKKRESWLPFFARNNSQITEAELASVGS